MRSGCPFPYASVPTKGKVTRIIHKNLHLREQNCVLALPPYFFWTFHIPPFSVHCSNDDKSPTDLLVKHALSGTEP